MLHIFNPGCNVSDLLKGSCLLCVNQAGIPDPPAMSADLIRQKARERHFLEQLLDGKKLENYKIPVPIKAELRKYQQVRLNFPIN